MFYIIFLFLLSIASLSAMEQKSTGSGVDQPSQSAAAPNIDILPLAGSQAVESTVNELPLSIKLDIKSSAAFAASTILVETKKDLTRINTSKIWFLVEAKIEQLIEQIIKHFREIAHKDIAKLVDLCNQAIAKFISTLEDNLKDYPLTNDIKNQLNKVVRNTHLIDTTRIIKAVLELSKISKPSSHNKLLEYAKTQIDQSINQYCSQQIDIDTFKEECLVLLYVIKILLPQFEKCTNAQELSDHCAAIISEIIKQYEEDKTREQIEIVRQAIVSSINIIQDDLTRKCDLPDIVIGPQKPQQTSKKEIFGKLKQAQSALKESFEKMRVGDASPNPVEQKLSELINLLKDMGTPQNSALKTIQSFLNERPFLNNGVKELLVALIERTVIDIYSSQSNGSGAAANDQTQQQAAVQENFPISVYMQSVISDFGKEIFNIPGGCNDAQAIAAFDRALENINNYIQSFNANAASDRPVKLLDGERLVEMIFAQSTFASSASPHQREQLKELLLQNIKPDNANETVHTKNDLMKEVQEIADTCFKKIKAHAEKRSGAFKISSEEILFYHEVALKTIIHAMGNMGSEIFHHQQCETEQYFNYASNYLGNLLKTRLNDSDISPQNKYIISALLEDNRKAFNFQNLMAGYTKLLSVRRLIPGNMTIESFYPVIQEEITTLVKQWASDNIDDQTFKREFLIFLHAMEMGHIKLKGVHALRDVFHTITSAGAIQNFAHHLPADKKKKLTSIIEAVRQEIDADFNRKKNALKQLTAPQQQAAPEKVKDRKEPAPATLSKAQKAQQREQEQQRLQAAKLAKQKEDGDRAAEQRKQKEAKKAADAAARAERQKIEEETRRAAEQERQKQADKAKKETERLAQKKKTARVEKIKNNLPQALRTLHKVTVTRPFRAWRDYIDYTKAIAHYDQARLQQVMKNWRDFIAAKKENTAYKTKMQRLLTQLAANKNTKKAKQIFAQWSLLTKNQQQAKKADAKAQQQQNPVTVAELAQSASLPESECSQSIEITATAQQPMTPLLFSDNSPLYNTPSPQVTQKQLPQAQTRRSEQGIKPYFPKRHRKLLKNRKRYPKWIPVATDQFHQAPPTNGSVFIQDMPAAGMPQLPGFGNQPVLVSPPQQGGAAYMHPHAQIPFLPSPPMNPQQIIHNMIMQHSQVIGNLVEETRRLREQNQDLKTHVQMMTHYVANQEQMAAAAQQYEPEYLQQPQNIDVQTQRELAEINEALQSHKVQQDTDPVTWAQAHRDAIFSGQESCPTCLSHVKDLTQLPAWLYYGVLGAAPVINRLAIATVFAVMTAKRDSAKKQ